MLVIISNQSVEKLKKKRKTRNGNEPNRAKTNCKVIKTIPNQTGNQETEYTLKNRLTQVNRRA